MAATAEDLSLTENPESQPAPPTLAWEHTFAIGIYGAGQGGAYAGGGLGARLRWEVIEHWLGVEVFGESFLINADTDRLRHDHQVGFNLYMPFELA